MQTYMVMTSSIPIKDTEVLKIENECSVKIHTISLLNHSLTFTCVNFLPWCHLTCPHAFSLKILNVWENTIHLFLHHYLCFSVKCIPNPQVWHKKLLLSRHDTIKKFYYPAALLKPENFSSLQSTNKSPARILAVRHLYPTAKKLMVVISGTVAWPGTKARPWGKYQVPHCSTSSLMTWMMGQKVPLARLLITQDWHTSRLWCHWKGPQQNGQRDRTRSLQVPPKVNYSVILF